MHGSKSDAGKSSSQLLLRLLLASALVGSTACGARASLAPGDAGPRCAWRELDIGIRENVTNIWGTAADDVYVSTEAKVVHFNGSRWLRLALPVGFPGDSYPNLVIASGQHGPLLINAGVAKREGDRWRVLAQPHLPCRTLGGIETTTGTVFVGCWKDIYTIAKGQWTRSYQGEGFLVRFWEQPDGTILVSGDSGTVLRFDGSRWYRVPTGDTHAHQDIWAPDDESFYVMSSGVEYGRVYRYHRNDKTLVLDTGLPWGAVGIWGSSETDIHVVGRGFWHFDGTSWQQVREHPNDVYTRVWGSGPENIYAGGSRGRFAHYSCRPE